jgi:hypothetical protein
MTPSPTQQERVDAAYTEFSVTYNRTLSDYHDERISDYELLERLEAADRALRDTLAKIERGE